MNKLISFHAFRRQYDIIKEFRSNNKDAVVDTMGTESHFPKKTKSEDEKFRVLVALILSVQTNDKITDRVINNLFKDGFTRAKARSLSHGQLFELISEVNFNNRKVEYIKEMAELFKQKKIPETVSELTQIKGIGNKIANLYTQIALGKVEGIAIDTHCHRIPNRLNWIHTRSPDETKKQIEDLLPMQEWAEFNINIVGFGQLICKAVKPLCSDCPLKNECTSQDNYTKYKTKRVNKPSKSKTSDQESSIGSIELESD